MNPIHRALLLCLCLSLATGARAMEPGDSPALPPWQVLEFERKALWATARSRMELPQPRQRAKYWEFKANSSVMDNSEQVFINFDPNNGQARMRLRLSIGNEQRLKSFGYGPEYIHRQRRNPDDQSSASAADWPVTSRKRLPYPTQARDRVVTSPYLLLYLAQTLYQQGPGASLDVVVHTDFNFYLVQLRCETGPVTDVDYRSTGQGRHSGKRETTAVTIEASPAGVLAEKDDFDLLGLHGKIKVLFDRASGIPVQLRGRAPRLGGTEINLKSVTMRTDPS